MKRDIFYCNFVRNVSLDFCATYNFPGNLFDFCSMVSSQLLMKELTSLLIHVRKIFNFRVPFKMLLSMYLIIVKKEHSGDQVTFRCHFQKISITVTEDVFIQMYFITVGSEQQKNKNAEYYSIFIPFKRKIIILLKIRESHFSLFWVMEFNVYISMFW